MAASFGTQLLPSVVVAVDPSQPFPCRVHPLGYVNTMDTSFKPSMLAPISAATSPPGGIANDPYLTGGQAAPKPIAAFPGSYQCFAFTGGRLSPRLALNFTILDGNYYRDVSGGSGRYLFNADSGLMKFDGGALDGQYATYQQPTTPPSKNQPPRVVFKVSGDTCDLKM
ncbi:MAG TPA: hypothetical protein VMI56_08650 [Reyranella sp.]|nr:hypothetical protein [Reyranella sp.]